MRILLTGANGFTGRYLKSELERRGHIVIALEADIRDGEAILAFVKKAMPAAVIHLAAVAFVALSDFETFYRVNQLGTYHLLNAVATASPSAHVLLVSSGNIYGNRDGRLIREDSVPDPVNHYAVSKWAMELGARQWSNDLSITIVRPFNYTGVGQDIKYLIPKIVHHYKRRAKFIELGNLDIRRDFGDVRSVVAAYADLIATPSAAGGIYNVCSGVSYSLREILDLVSELSNHKIDVKINPSLIRSSEVKILAGDPARLRAELPNWEPRDIRDTLNWMLAHIG